jgi:hypothetical protein
MKKLLFLFFFSVTVFLNAQEKETVLPLKSPKHEINFNLYSGYIESSHYFSSSNSGPDKFFYNEYQQHFFTGIQYKFFFNSRNAIRTGIGLRKTFINEGGMDGASSYSKTGMAYRRGISLGYEYVFSTKKIQPYVFADAEFQWESEIFSVSVQNGNGILPEHWISNYHYRSHSLGFLAGGGVKYLVLKNLFVGFESAIGASLFNKENVDAHLSAGKGRHFVLYPVRSLSLGFKF